MVLWLDTLRALKNTHLWHVIVTLQRRRRYGGEDLQAGYDCFLLSFFSFLLSFAIGFGM